MQMEERWGLTRPLSSEEYTIVNFAFGHEDLFADMLFRSGTICHSTIAAKIQYDGETEWKDTVIPLPDDLECFSYQYFEFLVDDLEEDVYGCFNSKEQTLTISPEHINDPATILHEMIHLHEFVLNELPLFYHDTYFWCLYKSLIPQIHDLDKLIEEQCHLLNEQQIYASGGLHDILFLLKSFDLDLRMGFRLGTVFGYGYGE